MTGAPRHPLDFDRLSVTICGRIEAMFTIFAYITEIASALRTGRHEFHSCQQRFLEMGFSP